MQVIVELRKDMLDIIKASIEHGSADQKIIFKDASDVTLAEIEFQDLVDAGDAQYMFRSVDDTNILKAVVVTDGRVATFVISGHDGSDVNPAALTGNVGTLTSTADIRFNKLDWSEGAGITITNLRIYVKQGT